MNTINVTVALYLVCNVVKANIKEGRQDEIYAMFSSVANRRQSVNNIQVEGAAMTQEMMTGYTNTLNKHRKEYVQSSRYDGCHKSDCHQKNLNVTK
jgi:hypothetical protein